MIRSLPDRLWRSRADVRRRLQRQGSAASALASLGRPQRRDQARWIAATADAHDRYRQQHAVPAERVLIACVSKRPRLIESVVQCISAQTHQHLDVAFVANDPAFDMDVVEEAFADVPAVSVMQPALGTSLGAALNLAMSGSSARYVAKFDDDDLYGANYVADALRAQAYAGAGIVGKHSYYAHLAQSDRTVLRFPQHEFSYSSTLAGGTLLIDRERVGDVEFPDVSIGEDRAFIARCHRAGVSTFAADRFNFVQTRGHDNTWSVSDADFARGAVPVGDGLDLSEVYR